MDADGVQAASGKAEDDDNAVGRRLGAVRAAMGSGDRLYCVRAAEAVLAGIEDRLADRLGTDRLAALKASLGVHIDWPGDSSSGRRA